MNDAGRGFSVDSHAAAGAPFDVTRGRARRPRFFSGSGARAAAGGGGAATGAAGGFASAAGIAFGTTFNPVAFAALAGAAAAGFAAAFGAAAGFTFAGAAFATVAAAFLATFLTAFAAAFTALPAVFFAGFGGAAFAAGFGGAFFDAGFGDGAAFFGVTFFFAAPAALFTRAATFFTAFLPAVAAFFP